MIFNKNKELSEFQIYAPISGTSIRIGDVPDPVFAEKMLGDGVAIIPTDGHFVSPVTGVITQVADTLHAYGIKTDDGLEVLVHIGIDTVNLAGSGFTAARKVGDRVAVGDPLAIVDLELIKSKGYDIHTPIVITNIGILKSLTVVEGPVHAANTVILKYTL
ncbi:MAG: PTS glucose transporter subunit IIA [Oscillospiraceae bacterium]